VDKDREISEQNIWVCSHCGTTNAIYLANCKNCGKNLDLEDDNSEDTTSEIIDDGQKWYYALSGERKGPVSKNTLINLYKHETIFLTTKVWNSNMPDWVELKQTGLISELNVPPPLHGSDVNNTLVWIVAFVPLLDIFLPLQNLSTVAQFLLFALINSILCIIDERQIKKSGHNPDEINLLFFAALLVPVYLFRRANILKQKYTYAITWCVSLIVSIFLRAALESGGYGNGDVGFFAVLTVFFILALIALVVFVEIKIGKAVGSMLSKETGLILGIILIVLGITLFIGIPVIIYSNKKKDGLDLPTANININPTTGKTNENGGSLLKFVGKNYKDILLENNLDEYVALFTENKLTDISIISGLTDSDFEKIGVTILGDRKRILKIFSTI
jgi:hypothetical protein